MADTWTPISGYTPQDYTDTMVFEMSSETKKVETIMGQALVAGEENSQYIKFVLPRYWDGIDISGKTFSIEYALSGQYYGTSEAVNAEMTTDKVRFGWVVPEEACCISGKLLFVLRIESADYILKSQIVEVSVYKSINVEDVVPEPTREAWYREFEARVNVAIADAEAALEAAQTAQTAAETAAQNAQTAEDNAEAAAASAQTRYGSPLTATTAEEMTDENRVYVYTGSESGYTAGNWYYYDGTAWTDGGVYNAVAVDTDTTLSIVGKAADAKKTGDEIEQIKEDFNELPKIVTLEDATEADLYICDANGNVLAKFEDGHIKTKNFDSSEVGTDMVKEADKTDADLYICDSFGNVIAEFKNGHIATKNFDSSGIVSDISEMSENIKKNTDGIYALKRAKVRMKFGAHNGAEWYAPECTIPAYRIAGQQKWEWAWVAGIYFSTDGTMYVIHDNTVDRTTDGTGKVTEMTDAQINALHIDQSGGTRYDLSDFDPAELIVPTLEQVIQQCVLYDMKMVLRLDNFPKDYTQQDSIAKWDYFVNLLKSYNVAPSDISCYVITGTHGNICRNLLGEDVEISTFLGRAGTAQQFIDWFSERNLTGNRAAIVNINNVNIESVKLLHSNGIRVYAYDEAPSEQNAMLCASLGVDIYQNAKIYRIVEEG